VHVTHSASPSAQRAAVDVAAYAVAVVLAGAAFFSVKGLVVIFPGSPVPVVIMQSPFTAGWLARRIALMVLCCDPLAIALTAATSSRRQLRLPSSTIIVHLPKGYRACNVI
jgi:hypothetical protein